MKLSDLEIPLEQVEHEAFMDWVSYHPLLKDITIHIPNEGKRTPQQGAKFKRLGLKKGIPDILVPIARSSYHGLWIELKRIRKYQISKQQKWWVDKLNELGYYAAFAYGWEHAKQIIEDYLSGKV